MLRIKASRLMYIYIVSKCPTCGYRLLYITTCLAREAVVHDGHAGIHGRALGVRTMYVAPYMASKSNMRRYTYSNNNTIYIYIHYVLHIITMFIRISDFTIAYDWLL